MHNKQDDSTPVTVNNLSDLFYERVKRSANKVAYRYYDEDWNDLTWLDISKKVELWHAAFRHEGLMKGDRVAIMMGNCPDWVIFDQAAYSLGLIVVPVYTNDRTENIRYILKNSNAKIFFIEEPTHCKELLANFDPVDTLELKDLVRIVPYKEIKDYNNPLLVKANNLFASYD